ncbi:MAG: toxin-antitoxin system HicB family antitoxin [Elusimicrobiota bacterium]|jgi:hypothetical protein
MKTRPAAKRPRKTYPLRIPPELHARLSEVAAKEQRTLNAQITHVLERWLEQQPGR